jgi:hypothetical protein
MRKICQQYSYRQNKCAKLEFIFFYTTLLFQRIWNQPKNLRILDMHMEKTKKKSFEVIEYRTLMSIFRI